MSRCDGCLCDKCKFNAESSKESEMERMAAWKEYDLCFNCDYCIHYGSDSEINIDNRKYKCDKYKISDYWSDIEARKRRKYLTVVSNS